VGTPPTFLERDSGEGVLLDRWYEGIDGEMGMYFDVGIRCILVRSRERFSCAP
jgi:hypothetical protein